ncbi:MAG: hypothetical protein QNJ47_04945 [Nostocaceae cyanobacterium]|nr:hypothetical protein [Nostocaceae cyanobacterium]
MNLGNFFENKILQSALFLLFEIFRHKIIKCFIEEKTCNLPLPQHEHDFLILKSSISILSNILLFVVKWLGLAFWIWMLFILIYSKFLPSLNQHFFKGAYFNGNKQLTYKRYGDKLNFNNNQSIYFTLVPTFITMTSFFFAFANPNNQWDKIYKIFLQIGFYSVFLKSIFEIKENQKEMLLILVISLLVSIFIFPKI